MFANSAIVVFGALRVSIAEYEVSESVLFQILHQDLLLADYAFPSSPTKKTVSLEQKVIMVKGLSDCHESGL